MDSSLPDKDQKWTGAAIVNIFVGPHDHALGGSPLDDVFHIPKADYDKIADGFFIDKYFASPPNSKAWLASIIMLRQRHTEWADEFIKREKLPEIDAASEMAKKLQKSGGNK